MPHKKYDLETAMSLLSRRGYWVDRHEKIIEVAKVKHPGIGTLGIFDYLKRLGYRVVHLN